MADYVCDMTEPAVYLLRHIIGHANKQVHYCVTFKLLNSFCLHLHNFKWAFFADYTVACC